MNDLMNLFSACVTNRNRDLHIRLNWIRVLPDGREYTSSISILITMRYENMIGEREEEDILRGRVDESTSRPC